MEQAKNEKSSEEKNDFAIKPQKPAKPNKGKFVVGLVFLILGIVATAAGATFLALKLTQGPKIQDGEYLVATGEFTLENEPGVIWNFTEIGKGKLTTNDHLNDYDFEWALEGDKLKIETAWLYPLYNEFTYRVEDGILILTQEKTTAATDTENDNNNLLEIKFYPASGVDTEITEDDELVVGD